MSAAFVLGAGAIAVAPATAATYTTSGDVTIFNSDGTNTYLDPSADLGSVLNGNSGAPGGNVELNDGAANANLNAPANTLTANLDSGRVVTFSSLTSDDWFGSGNLAQQWFGEAMGVYGTTIRTRFEGYLVSQGYSQQQAQFAASDDNNIFAAFNNQGGFARLSDPNIAYVNESAAGVTFGLAAHSDAGNVNPLLAGLYASEVVKVSLNGETEYYYSFDVPGVSGQTSRDGTNSHEGNYEFFIADPQNEESVPEPAAILGLVAVGGVLVAKRKQQAA
ncbi:MAG: NF038130 family PEP-CTERM protein [Cyanobacteria bacterium P01_H01_bin.119]